MEREKLLKDYLSGQLSETGWLELEKAVSKGAIQLDELGDTSQWMDRLDTLEEKALSQRAQQRFYDWLDEEDRSKTHITAGQSWWYAAAAVLIFASGIGLGALLDSGQKYEEQISQITGDLRNVQEMMMFTLLKEGSTSDRLKAVNYTDGLDQVSAQIAEELIHTLNHDNNVNVRLATVHALAKYIDSPQVREGLINSINNQDSPLVQMALIEVMAALREKSAIKELQKLRGKENTTPEVKEKTEQAIQILT